MIPEGWKLKKLASIAAERKDKADPKFIDSARYIGLEHIEPKTPALCRFGSSLDVTSLKTNFKEGDILFGKLRPYLEKVAIAGFDGICSTDIIAIRSLDGIDPCFLYYVFASRKVISHAVGTSAGTKMPRTSWGQLASLEVLVPSNSEQKRIAEILTSVDEAIQATEKVIDQTKRVKQGLLQELLTRGIGHTKFKMTEIGEIPESWRLATLGSLCRFINGNGFKSKDWSKEGLPIIRIQNLNGSNDFNYYQGDVNEKWIVNSGDILFAWAGVKGVSFGARIWSGGKGLLNQHIFRLDPKIDLNKLWLYQAIKMVTLKIESNAHGFKSTLLHVRKDDIANQIVAFPPFHEQVEIGEKINETEELEGIYSKNALSIKKLKHGLMQDLLTGKVRVGGLS